MPATLKYKIYTFYVGHTYQSTKVKKCLKYFRPGEYNLIDTCCSVTSRMVFLATVGPPTVQGTTWIVCCSTHWICMPRQGATIKQLIKEIHILNIIGSNTVLWVNDYSILIVVVLCVLFDCYRWLLLHCNRYVHNFFLLFGEVEQNLWK